MLEAHPQYYEELKQRYDELFYRQEALGEYLNIFSGGCYPSFKEDRNAKILVEYEPNLGGMAWALDFNVDPMAALICQRKGPRRLDILKEITLRPGDTERMCEAFVVAAQPYLSAWRLTHGGQRLPVTLYGDAAGHARSLVGKAIYAIIQQYFQLGARLRIEDERQREQPQGGGPGGQRECHAV